MLLLLTNVRALNTVGPLSADSTSAESTNFSLRLVDSMNAEPVYAEDLPYYAILYKRLEHPQILVSVVGGWWRGKRGSQNHYLPATEG